MSPSDKISSEICIPTTRPKQTEFLPSPLKGRINVLVTNHNKKDYLGADQYISGDIESHIFNLSVKYENKDVFVIGGAEILNQSFNLIEKFYLTRIYGDFKCDKRIDLKKIQESMQMIKKIDNDKTCHFEIWKK